MIRRPPKRVDKDIQVSLLGSNVLIMGVSKRGRTWLESRFDKSLLEIPIKNWLTIAQDICDSGLVYEDAQRLNRLTI